MRRFFVGTPATDGGLPLVQNDLKLMQDAIAEAIAGAATLGGVSSYIITGCNIVSRGGAMQGTTAGILMLNGEICLVDADMVGIDTSVNPILAWYWTTEISYDISGLKVFASGGASINTYQTTKAVIGYSGTPPSGSISVAAIARQEKLLAQMLQVQPLQFTRTIGFAKGTVSSMLAGFYT
jgi:hypothetical protein